MYIGKVIGSVVSTVKISHLEGRTLLLVDQLDLGGKETGAYDIAVDTVQAGPGDTVLVHGRGKRGAPDPRARSRRDTGRRRGRRRRGERGRLGRQRGLPAARTARRTSSTKSGFRLAPPTSAPSISGISMKPAVLSTLVRGLERFGDLPTASGSTRWR